MIFCAHRCRYFNSTYIVSRRIRIATFSSVSHVNDLRKGDSSKLVDSLLRYTSSLITSSSQNLIAFSGGIDSSLVASLVHKVSNPSKTLAIVGVSNSLPPEQLELARSIARHIGIDLKEMPTNEGADPIYIENKGQSCYICKTHLYSSISAVSNHAQTLGAAMDAANSEIFIFNGTNKDDTKDSTRVGLQAAAAFEVRSPLIHITKEQVRQAACHLGLPNWNHAASPCLRSRLAFGVEATELHLKTISEAENFVRSLLNLGPEINLRVRMLAKKRARIELDEDIIEFARNVLLQEEKVDNFFKSLGFVGFDVKEFKSGSVATHLKKKLQQKHISPVEITYTKRKKVAL